MIYMDKPTGGRQKGQALVELALTLPLILLLVLGAMDFGRMFTTKQSPIRVWWLSKNTRVMLELS